MHYNPILKINLSWNIWGSVHPRVESFFVQRRQRWRLCPPAQSALSHCNLSVIGAETQKAHSGLFSVDFWFSNLLWKFITSNSHAQLFSNFDKFKIVLPSILENYHMTKLSNLRSIYGGSKVSVHHYFLTNRSIPKTRLDSFQPDSFPKYALYNILGLF